MGCFEHAASVSRIKAGATVNQISRSDLCVEIIAALSLRCRGKAGIWQIGVTVFSPAVDASLVRHLI